MDYWTFDMLMAYEVLDVNMLPIIILKFVICYDFVNVLNLDFDLLFNFCTFAQEHYKTQVAFHSPAHVGAMAQGL